jgi:hypothetical protein
MKFIPWIVRNSWFHLIILFTCIVIALTWQWDTDKLIALSFISIVITVLITGKYFYWRKNVKNYKRKNGLS